MGVRHAIAALTLAVLAGCTTTIDGNPQSSPFADTPAVQFLANLHRRDITTGTEESDLRWGREVCTRWERGGQWDDIYPAVYTVAGLGEDAALFVVVATTRLCPLEIPNLPGQ